MPLPLLLRDLCRLAGGEGLPDAELLARFTRDRDESAFAALVGRHGPMVLGVCRRVLGDAGEVEDAFQATFLPLVRKANGLARPDALAGWLHGVALNVALNARARRRPVPLAGAASLPGPADADPLARLTARELLTLLDEEIRRLPEVCRGPVVLCCLEGLTQEEVARRLGWTPGSVKGRLERGRRRLHARLAKRGLSLPAALAAAEVARGAAGSARLVRAPAGVPRGGTEAVEALAEAAAKGMAVSKTRVVLTALVAVALTLGGAATARRALTEATPAADDTPGAAKREGQPPARVDALGGSLPPRAVARFGTVRLRHGGRVAGLAFSRDGKTLATSDDGLGGEPLRFWDVATGKEVRRIPCPSRLCHFTALAYSPDGRVLAAAESGPYLRPAGVEVKEPIRFWDVASGKVLSTCAAHVGGVAALSFAPDGKALASCSYDKTVRLWEVATGRELYCWKGHQQPVYCLAFSPDGKTLASGGYDKAIRLWDLATGKQRAVFGGQPGAVEAVAFSPDGTLLAAGYLRENRLRLIDVASGEVVRELKGHTNDPQGLAFLPGGRELVSAARDGTVRVWEVATGKERRRMRCDSDDFHHLALSPDGKVVAAGGQGRVAQLWDLTTGKSLHAFAGHSGPVLSLRYAPDGKTLATGGMDGTLRLWDVGTGKERKLTNKDGVWIGCVVFSPDGKTLLADDGPGNAFSMWDVASGALVRRFPGHRGGTSGLAYSPDGKTVASGGQDKLIRLWDAGTGKELRGLAGHTEGVGTVAFSPDGKLLASLGNYKDRERKVYLWDLARGAIRYRLGPARYGSLAFTSDGRSVTAASDGETIRVWDTTTGEESRVLKVPGRPTDLEGVFGLGGPTFSPDEKYLAFGWHGSVRVFEFASWQEVTSFAGTGSPLGFAPDGRTIAAAGKTDVLLWDLTGRAPEGRLRARRLGPEALEALWDDLSSDEAPRGHRAVWSLVAGAEQSVPFLREQLARRPAVEDEQVRQWIARLDSDQFAVREVATGELKKLGRFAEPALRQALRGNPPPEPRRRIEQLLQRLATPAYRLHASRVTEVLEQAGTPEAREVLEALAKGEGLLGRQAKASLARLQRPRARGGSAR